MKKENPFRMSEWGSTLYLGFGLGSSLRGVL